MRGRTFVMSQFMYPDPSSVRAELARDLAQGARERNCEVYVSDGTGGRFREGLIDLRVNVSNQIPGMGPDRRRLMQLVCEHMGPWDVALWTEEKPSLMLDIALIVEPIFGRHADLVIPARTDEAWMSHPREQIFIEKFCNTVFAAATGAEVDCWFGPFAATRDVIRKFFLKEPEEGGDDKWLSIHRPRIDAIAAGIPVASVFVPNYRYDARQRAEEEGNIGMMEKRVAQCNSLVPPLLARAKQLGLCK